MGRVGERGVGAFPIAPVPDLPDIAGRIIPDRRCAGCERIGNAHRSGVFLDIEFDHCRAVIGLGAGLGDHQHNRLAHMTDLSLCEARSRGVERRVGLDLRRLIFRPARHDMADTGGRQIIPGEDRNHAGHLASRIHVDAANGPVRDRRPDKRRIGLPVPVDVVSKPSGPRQQSDILAPAHRLRNPVCSTHALTTSVQNSSTLAILPAPGGFQTRPYINQQQ